MATPAISDDGTIYIPSWDDYLYAFNPDGAVKWRFYTDCNADSSPAIADDGTIYYATLWSLGKGGKIYALNPDGTEKWHYQTGYGITSDPAIGEDGTIYIGSIDSYLYALYPNGTLRWRFKTDGEIHGNPSIADDGTIYIGSFDDYLYAINPDGTKKWEYEMGEGTSGNPSIGTDGTIYVGSDKLYAVNPDGTSKWSFNLGTDKEIHLSSPAISSDGTIFVGVVINGGYSNGGEILAINSDGTERWRKKIANNVVQSSPCIGEDGTVYIGSASVEEDPIGYLHAFGQVTSNDNPNTPTITGRLEGKVGNPYHYYISTTDPDNNLVYLYIDWGDGTNSGWEGPYFQPEEETFTHKWLQDGTYTIKAKAKDDFGGESDWGELTVSMPRYKPTSVLYWFLDQHSLLFQILQYLLRPLLKI